MNAREIQIRRLRLRSWRRGIREMDLILGAYADDRLAELSDEDRDTYEAMLDENDQELYTWVSGRIAPPPRFESLVTRITDHMKSRGGASRS